MSGQRSDSRPPLEGKPFLMTPIGCTMVGMVGNVGLSAGKIIFGIMASSTALIADGFHSLADVMSDIGILLALKAAQRPPDANHPYGHHSFETLGAVIVAVFMLLTAFLIGRSAVLEIIHHDHQAPLLIALWASLVSVVIKEVMARYTLFVAKRHNSPALQANGTMHRSDAISSLAAAAGIGGAQFGWPILDSLAALVIALFISRLGWDLLRENIMTLMDTMPAPELIAAIGGAATSVGCVQEVRDIKVRQRGSYYLADLRISIHPRHTIGTAHEIAHQVEKEILTNVSNVSRVFVHVEPGEARTEHNCRVATETRDAINGVENDPPVRL